MPARRRRARRRFAVNVTIAAVTPATRRSALSAAARIGSALAALAASTTMER